MEPGPMFREASSRANDCAREESWAYVSDSPAQLTATRSG
ncbi:hypothetical protein SMICM17S_06902 [Streptomyces microflavus]